MAVYRSGRLVQSRQEPSQRQPVIARAGHWWTTPSSRWGDASTISVPAMPAPEVPVGHEIAPAGQPRRVGEAGEGLAGARARANRTPASRSCRRNGRALGAGRDQGMGEPDAFHAGSDGALGRRQLAAGHVENGQAEHARAASWLATRIDQLAEADGQPATGDRRSPRRPAAGPAQSSSASSTAAPSRASTTRSRVADQGRPDRARPA